MDERCDYLRKTYRSLHAGRQKLHARMMAYLKRENGAIFTREGLIRQEEALAELDVSLDDWISKIEQAENRRLRIRQKVLEHFCAAITLTTSTSQAQTVMSPEQAVRVQVLQRSQEQTPPRSPVERATDSPNMFTMLPLTVATTTGMTAISPMTMEHEIKPLQMDGPKIGDPEKRRDVQSIKIYADGDVLDLFSDIEQAIDHMFDYDEKREMSNDTSSTRKGSSATT